MTSSEKPVPQVNSRFARWTGTGIFFFLGGSVLLAVALHVWFGLPMARLITPITVFVVIQLGLCAAIYWFRQRFEETQDLRIGVAIFGLYALVLVLTGMYYAGTLGLSSPSLFRDNCLGFSVFMLVVISICLILLPYTRTSKSRS
jgi:ABC-type Mn2+/Zn2+ transport system permease subunit